MPRSPTMARSLGTKNHTPATSIVITKPEFSTLRSDIFCCFLSQHWTYVHRLFAKPTILDAITNPLAGRKRMKIEFTQRRFSEWHLYSVVAADHTFLLISIDVPDHSLHASHSYWLPQLRARFPCFV